MDQINKLARSMARARNKREREREQNAARKITLVIIFCLFTHLKQKKSGDGIEVPRWMEDARVVRVNIHQQYTRRQLTLRYWLVRRRAQVEWLLTIHRFILRAAVL